jgi:hypothetical protein
MKQTKGKANPKELQDMIVQMIG